MAMKHKFKLVLKNGIVEGIRPKGIKNLKTSNPIQVADLIKKWDLKEGVPVHVLADKRQEADQNVYIFTELDPEPSIGY